MKTPRQLNLRKLPDRRCCAHCKYLDSTPDGFFEDVFCSRDPESYDICFSDILDYLNNICDGFKWKLSIESESDHI